MQFVPLQMSAYIDELYGMKCWMLRNVWYSAMKTGVWARSGRQPPSGLMEFSL